MNGERTVERAFKGIWIPREIWLARSLTPTETILLSEINSLNGDDGCTASDAYFAAFMGCSTTAIQNHVSSLKAKGYIFTESFNGRKRILRVAELRKPCEHNSANLVSCTQEKNESTISNKKDYKKDNKGSELRSQPTFKKHYQTIKDFFFERWPEHFACTKDFQRESGFITDMVEYAIKRSGSDQYEAQEKVLSILINTALDVFEGKVKELVWMKGTPPLPSQIMSKGRRPFIIEEIERRSAI